MFYNGLTDIDGILVGHDTDATARTGCTVVMCQSGAVAGVDVRGAAPGTRETDLLRGYNSVERIHAIALCGGSAYGLDAASGVMRYLEEQGIGVDVGVGVVPIVPAAVLFDLGIGNPNVRPDHHSGYRACQAASVDAPLRGAIGAGTGATVGKALGPQYAMQSGIGSCCLSLPDGVKVAAMVAVNALGDVYNYKSGELLAAACVNGHLTPCLEQLDKLNPSFSNTTIGIIATNAILTREEANKLASIGHDGLAMSIRPVHTCLDGDTLFALSTGVIAYPLLPLLAAAAQATAHAVMDAVLSVKSCTNAHVL